MDLKSGGTESLLVCMTIIRQNNVTWEVGGNNGRSLSSAAYESRHFVGIFVGMAAIGIRNK